MKYLITCIVIVVGIGYFSLKKYGEQNLKKQSGLIDDEKELSWQEEANSVSLLNNGEIIWRLNHDESEDKPYFYPLRTLDGVDLALQRPADHPWHRGLWFSWKTINELNYWEENPKTGLSPGRTIIKEVDAKLHEDYSATITFELAYGPEGKKPLMLEHRELEISSPDEDGSYRIDWTLRFEARDKDLVLDREVPLKHGGVEWGGYAGLGFRASDTALDSIRFLDSNGWSNSKNLTGYGKDANWMDLSGVGQNIDSKAAGLTIFDHPDNPRHPSPWYVWYQKGEHAFYMPAFLYNKSYSLRAGESFTLKYRVLAHIDREEFKDLKGEYRDYTE